ncbi:DUF5320 domain-containing protein [Clostridium sp.]|uniref:DUF5320 domain-containing protein n=1 Tax=Clostridium sp. TaxID=1506 RepID=UPI003D6CB2F4
MSRRDGTGPNGMGARTGRGMGFCNVTKVVGEMGRLGLGLRNGRGTGRVAGSGLRNITKVVGVIGGLGLSLGLGSKKSFLLDNFKNLVNSENPKKLLSEEKTIIENKLSLMNNQMNTQHNDK